MIRRATFALCLLGAPLYAQSLAEELLPFIEPDSQTGEIPVPELPAFISSGGVRSANSDAANAAVLRGLDTITGTVGNFQISVGETLQFERLSITLEACRYPQGDIDRDAFALLSIQDIREDTARFHGWMVASSPALVALDHPRYDIWVISCVSG
ncbi:MAG: DUF2155 domain-containing protein [Paracoccaceae bacterium]